MPGKTMKLDPVTRYVRGLPGPEYLLAREAAAELGIGYAQLMKLGTQRPDTLGPGFVTWMGEMKIFLYTQADIEQLRAYLDGEGRDVIGRRGHGREPMWSPEEHADRHRRRALASYHRTAAVRFAKLGQHDQSELNRTTAVEIAGDLARQRAQRLDQLKGERAAADAAAAAAAQEDA